MAHGDWAWVFVCEYVVRMAWRKIVNGKERERERLCKNAWHTWFTISCTPINFDPYWSNSVKCT